MLVVRLAGKTVVDWGRGGRGMGADRTRCAAIFEPKAGDTTSLIHYGARRKMTPAAPPRVA